MGVVLGPTGQTSPATTDTPQHTEWQIWGRAPREVCHQLHTHLLQRGSDPPSSRHLAPQPSICHGKPPVGYSTMSLGWWWPSDTRAALAGGCAQCSQLKRAHSISRRHIRTGGSRNPSGTPPWTGPTATMQDCTWDLTTQGCQGESLSGTGPPPRIFPISKRPQRFHSNHSPSCDTKTQR